MIAGLIKEIRDGVQIEGHSYAQRLYMQKGIKIYGENPVKGYKKELDQMHRRNAFEPVDVKQLATSKKSKAQSAIWERKRTGTQRVGWYLMGSQPKNG